MADVVLQFGDLIAVLLVSYGEDGLVSASGAEYIHHSSTAGHLQPRLDAPSANLDHQGYTVPGGGGLTLITRVLS